ncbi:hypothetical protein T4B_15001 [Trichinella pseudospiralis]|uniref:Uncharacterized protein n=1 Tax=Trichinella pseudospiralis TaxID=6337 RepID=A0A0V1IP29_TRIPS|nr:hypothetical protein T4B_15001 [Trichinella pseudospiralis]
MTEDSAVRISLVWGQTCLHYQFLAFVTFLCGGKMAGSYDWFLPWDGLITLSHSLASGRFTASS